MMKNYVLKNDKMKKRQWLITPLALGVTVGIAGGVLQAAPDDGPGMGDNPPNQQGGRGGRDNRPNFRNMTDVQRQEWEQQRQKEMQQRREEDVQRTLTEAGFTDKTLQDAVIAFVNAQDTTRDASRDEVRKLSEAVRGNATDNEVAALLADLRASAQTAKTQRAASLKALDAKIGYTKKPKLDAILTLMGVTGDEVAALGGRGMGGPGGRGGPGGFGGGPGGRGGGPGGRGGGPGGRDGRGGGPDGPDGPGGPPAPND